MTKSIYTLVPDVYQLLGEKGWYNELLNSSFQTNLSARLQEQWGDGGFFPRLRLSQMGDRCPRSLWYSIHHPELAERLPPWAQFKYIYGHTIEQLALMLAKAAGHTVEGEQDELDVNGVKGHRDAVIDGCVVDVKSTTHFTMEKAKRRTLETDDNFGYLDQLDGYVLGSANDPLVITKDKGYLWCIDRSMGHMHVYEHTARFDRILRRTRECKDIVGRSDIPACTCETRPRGRSGNVELAVKASYNPFKFCCFPNLRIFLYADGPAYLTKVEDRPSVSEIDRNGNLL